MRSSPTLSYHLSALLVQATRRNTESFADNSANAEISAGFFVVNVNISASYAWSSRCNAFVVQIAEIANDVED